MTRARRSLLIGCTVLALVGAACTAQRAGGASAGPEGGGGGDGEIGGTIKMARADWDTGWMQAAIYQQLLEELGYDVADPATNTRDPNGFYPALATGQFDLWANGWFPGHDIFLQRTLFTGQKAATDIEPVGVEVDDGALQGYLVDKATADEAGITSMDDFARPEIAAMFDTDGDGRADLAGCNAGWGCNPLVEAHIEQFDWGSNVEQVVGDYWAQFDDVQSRVAAGEPALFYTWTPNWTVGELVPGEDVVWLESSRLPEDEGESTVPGLDGCASDPCDLGFVVNDIRAVANTGFLDANPAVRRLLEVVEIPLADIDEQNTRMAESDTEYTNEQIQADATQWIEDNRDQVDAWLQTARGQ